jgi:hypothetical protein
MLSRSCCGAVFVLISLLRPFCHPEHVELLSLWCGAYFVRDAILQPSHSALLGNNGQQPPQRKQQRQQQQQQK